jgi:hypothetical protein
MQLYDLSKDAGETENLYEQYPDVVKEMSDLMEKYIRDGRSTEGPLQKNVPSDQWPGLSWLAD